MKILPVTFALFALVSSGCAQKPVNDPKGNWLRQAQTFDGSLFND